MAAKPETTFIRNVHKHLDALGTYHEKMNNPFLGGTADVWYSGRKGDLWVEYKYIPKTPRSDTILPNLSERQKKWLGDRHNEGRNVVVVLGVGTKAKIYRYGKWLEPQSDTEINEYLITREELAGWIYNQTGSSPSCASTLLPPS